MGIWIAKPLHPPLSPLALQSLASKGTGKEILGCQPSVAEVLPPADPAPLLPSLGTADKEASPSAGPKPTVVLPFPDFLGLH